MSAPTRDHLDGWGPGFWRLLEAVPDAIVVTGAEARIVTVNEQAERLFGYARDELVGQPIECLVPERLRGAHAGHRSRPSAAPFARPMGVAGVDLAGRRKDGTEFPAEISLSPMVGERGPLTVAAVRDVSERRRIDEERTKLREAEAAISARDELLSIASHELKTPIAAILLLTQRLQRQRADLPAAFGQSVDKLGRQSQRLSTLINALLDLARIRAGRLEPELCREGVDVGVLVASVIEDCSDLIAQSRSRVELRRDGKVECECDKGRTEQVVTNLLSNALKFGGGRPIAVSLSCVGGFVELRVEDHGPGIAPELLAHLFDRFERGGSAPGRAGLGLGLYISRGIATAHGGTIAVESRVGEGTTFTVRLPCAPRDSLRRD